MRLTSGMAFQANILIAADGARGIHPRVLTFQTRAQPLAVGDGMTAGIVVEVGVDVDALRTVAGQAVGPEGELWIGIAPPIRQAAMEADVGPTGRNFQWRRTS